MHHPSQHFISITMLPPPFFLSTSNFPFISFLHVIHPLFFTFLPPASSFFFTITFCLCQRRKRDDRRPQNQDLLTAAVRTHLSGTCTSVYARVSARMFTLTHTQTHRWRQLWVVVVSPRHQPILSATTLENTLHTLIYLFNFSDWWFFFPLFPFNFQANYFDILRVLFFLNILSNLSVKLIFKRLILKNLYTF